MIAVIAIVVSGLALLINIIVNFDKLKKFFEDLGNWQKQQINNQKTIDAAKKNELIESIRKRDESKDPKTFPILLSQFLISVIFSAIISFFDFSSIKIMDIPSRQLLNNSEKVINNYFGISFTIMCIIAVYHILLHDKILNSLPRNRIGLFLLFYGEILYIYFWVTLVLLLIFISIPPFYAGLIASGILFIQGLYIRNRWVRFAKSLRDRKI